MPAQSLPAGGLRAPLWFSMAALAGVAWNLFGAVQFVGSATATAESLVDSGLTPEQAAVMTGYPAWMTLAFAIGVAGGFVGSVLLFLRRPLAQPVFAGSLASYAALWIGDVVHGVFAAMGAPQIIILTTVVAIAAALFALSRHSAARA
jgi:hypothetical protein